jgi:hypothetical protein
MKYLYFWTDKVNANLEKKIMRCFDKTFSQISKKNYFKWKYRNNTFGKSLHIIALDKKKVVASRAFWRLDINKIKSYQCVDTSVLPDYQKRGIFKKTSLMATKILKNKIIYNSPSNNSGFAYRSCGWKNVKNSNLTKINFTTYMLNWAPTIKWNKKTLDWRFKQNPIQKYYNLKRGKFYYIFRKIGKKFFLLIGKTKIKLGLNVCNPFICFSYDSNCPGLPIKVRHSWMYRGGINYKKIHSYLFDLT